MFFYSNEYGSRVYFDEVGPPWPKHPCTDNAAHQTRSTSAGTRSSPIRYGFVEGRMSVQSAASQDTAGHGGLTPVGRAYGAGAWTPHTLVSIGAGPTGATLTLRKLYTVESGSVWSTAFAVPLAPSDVVFLKAGNMSYFDMGRGESVAVPVSYVGAARGMLSWLRDLWTGTPASAAPAGWHSDPVGRHAYRYWNGSVWTEYVSPGNGQTFSDPLH
ncbi:DUF2510 domain-containing protein [Catellatospora sp. NPDC049133]|uniref:DUF2510 domain-containing protein n=1 Tax=Catellatospora sp. NPDC049133 TaxID=3155499 RepID=UPI0033F978CF